jgi:hypothetical protein
MAHRGDGLRRWLTVCLVPLVACTHANQARRRAEADSIMRTAVAPSRPLELSVREDNDGMGIHTNGQGISDGYYTQGFELRARSQQSPVLNISAGFSQLIYTPNDLTISNLAQLRGDQPYAGWLYAFLGAQLRLGRWTLGSELEAGVIGPAAQGGSVQAAWHQLLRQALSSKNPPRPAGLGVYEIANAPGIDLTLSVEHRFAALLWGLGNGRWARQTGSTAGLQLFWTAQVEGGTVYGRARGGAGFRVGLFGPPTLQSSAFELYLFAQAEVMGVGWNRLLQGPLVDGVPNETRLRQVVPVGSLGLVLHYRHFGLFFGQVVQEQDLTSLPSNAELWHHYGQAALSWRW